jgi:hypothetical protein
MAISNTRLLDTDITEVFQAVGQQIISVVYLCNTSASPVTVDVYCVNGDNSTIGSNNNIIYSQLEITANDTYVMSTEKLILDDGDQLEVRANVSDVLTVTVSSFAA